MRSCLFLLILGTLAAACDSTLSRVPFDAAIDLDQGVLDGPAGHDAVDHDAVDRDAVDRDAVDRDDATRDALDHDAAVDTRGDHGSSDADPVDGASDLVGDHGSPVDAAPTEKVDYYVSASGDNTDGLTPQTAWTSLAVLQTKLDNKTIQPGDVIGLHRGESFSGGLGLKTSGTAAKPIVLTSYGTGAKAILTGFKKLTSWTNEGGGVYSHALTSEAQTNMVTINGVNTPMGRWPNTGYRIFESANANVSITDNELTATTNWKGAELVVRKNLWTLDRCLITDQTGGTLTYQNLGTTQAAKVNHGYFIQNDRRTLDAFGEWYHDHAGGKFYMVFGTTSPSASDVRVATQTHNFHATNNPSVSHIHIRNLQFEGTIGDNISIFGYISEDLAIENCTLRFSGANGIFIEGARNVLLQHNVIEHSATAAINSQGNGDVTIANNTIRHSGTVPGQALSAASAHGIRASESTLAALFGPHLIANNRISTSGNNGISFGGNNDIVRNNLIEDSASTVDDAGGIYTGGDKKTGRVIEGNIVLHSIGVTDGTPNTASSAEGIYLDETCTNVLVQDNTVAHCGDGGIKIHKSHDDAIKNNAFFNNRRAILFGNWDGVKRIYNMTVEGNLFIAREATQQTFFYYATVDDIPSMGTLDNNVYARPINNTASIYYRQPNATATATLAGWQAFSGQDANSKDPSYTVGSASDFFFEYNATDATVQVALPTPMKDFRGKTYAGTVSIPPWRSVVLIPQ